MRTTLLAAVVALAASAPAVGAENGLTKGTPEIKSISALAFGPNGLLFIGDPTGSAIYAIDTGDTKVAGHKDVSMNRIDSSLAAVFGTTDKDIRINDLKVNPASGNLYIAATRGAGAGTPGLVRITRTGTTEAVSLKNIPFARVAIANPGRATGKGGATTILTSMSFLDGKLYAAGLSNEQFASTLRVIPFPFAKETDKGTAIEIFHGAHGRIETQAPIRTFVTYKVGKEDNIMAAYTCTPLVKIPVADLKPGVKVVGRTVAELGNGNQPLDMVQYSKDGKDYLLMTNSKRGVMKIPTTEFGTAGAITARPSTTLAGIKYDSIEELKNVVQLDKLDDARAVIITKTDAGFDLKTIPLP